MTERIIYFGPFRTTTKDMKSNQYHLRNMVVRRSPSPINEESFKRQLFVKDRNQQKLIDQMQGDEISNRLTFRQDPISQRKIFKLENTTHLDRSLMPIEQEKSTFKKMFQSLERSSQNQSPSEENKGRRRFDNYQDRRKISFIKSRRQYDLALNSQKVKELLNEIPIYESRVQYKLYTPLQKRVQIENLPLIKH